MNTSEIISQNYASEINNHINTPVENYKEEVINRANEQIPSCFDYELDDDGSINCVGYWNFCPVLKLLIEKGCPPEGDIVLSAHGNTEISLNVSWGKSPIYDDLAVTVLYFDNPIKFWREITIHKDLTSEEYDAYKKYERHLDMDELDRFISDLQEMSVQAIELYYYGNDTTIE